MRVSGAFLLIALAALAGPTSAQDPDRAVGEALEADRSARELRRESEDAEDAAHEAETRLLALADDVQRFEHEVTRTERRLRRLDRERSVRLDAVAEEHEGLTVLLASLQRMARRPALAALLQPSDAVEAARVAAMIEALRPQILARTEDLRADLARVDALRTQAQEQRANLRTSRADLEQAMTELRAAASAYRTQARGLSADAAAAEARAQELAVQAVDAAGFGEASPLPEDVVRSRRLRSYRPSVSEVASLGYRAPVAGRIAQRFGRPNEVGVISRGVSVRVRPSALVTAPADGAVAYAGPFRDYGDVVILQHGEDMTTILSGLGDVSVAEGEQVAAGLPLGTAAEDGQVDVELRRSGNPVDPMLYIREGAEEG